MTVKGERPLSALQFALLSNICTVLEFSGFQFALLSNICTVLTLPGFSFALQHLHNCLTQWKLKLTLIRNGFPNLSCSLYCRSTHSARSSLCLSCSARCRLQCKVQFMSHLHGARCKVQVALCKVQAARQEVVTAASPGTPIFPPPPCPHQPTIGSKLSTLLPAQQSVQPFCSHRLSSTPWSSS